MSRTRIPLSKRGGNLSPGLSLNPSSHPSTAPLFPGKEDMVSVLPTGVEGSGWGWVVQVCGSKGWEERMEGKWEFDD